MIENHTLEVRRWRLFAGAALLCALVGGANAGSIPGLIDAPPVGAARPVIPPATGTIVTPVTPTVPPAPVPGRSTITIPGASGSGAASTRNPGTVRPCGQEASAAGAAGGNAGIVTTPGANNEAAGFPNLPWDERADRRRTTTTNPSVRPGVPGSC